MSMYTASVPIFNGMLTAVAGWLDKAEAHAAEKKFDIDVLLNARLAPDMFPLAGQIKLACAFAKNGACRIAGETPPDFDLDAIKTLDDLRGLIKRTQDIVNALPEAAIKAGGDRECTFRAGPDATMTLNGGDYLNKYALPQFYFHVTAAYAILRHNGVELGKKDFLGALLS